MLLSNNYFYSKNSSVLEIIAEAEAEELNKTYYILNSFPLCTDCNEVFLKYKSIKLACLRTNSCSACYDKLSIKNTIEIREDWIDNFVKDIKTPSIN